MKLLFTGGSGLLGQMLTPLAEARGHQIIAPSSSEFDISNEEQIAELATQNNSFDYLINLAGYTAVDKAETDRKRTWEVNTHAPSLLAAACAANGTRIVHISTDYVFGGGGTAQPYSEEDKTNPIQYYGQTKADGEVGVLAGHSNALIIRVSWLHGPHKPCFPRGVVQNYLDGKPLKIVSDQIGLPSATSDVSRMILDLLDSNPISGIWHIGGLNPVSRYDYAKAALEAYCKPKGLEIPEVEPVASADFPTPAARPDFSVLSTAKVLKSVEPPCPIVESLGWLNDVF